MYAFEFPVNNCDYDKYKLVYVVIVETETGCLVVRVLDELR